MTLALLTLAALALAEDVGLHVRSIELVDMAEPKLYGRTSKCFLTGCKFTGTRVSLECSAESSPNSQPPQPFNYRIDCRGATGGFQNLTVYDLTGNCGRLSYKKYKNGHSSGRGDQLELAGLTGNTGRHVWLYSPSAGHVPIPTTPWLPWIFDHIVTLEKDDVIDLQGVLLPFDVPFRHLQGRQSGRSDWWVSMRLVEDGLSQSEKSQSFIHFSLSSPSSMFPSCATAVEKTYEWTMELWESINDTHILRLKSPTLGLLELPKLDLETEQGEIFQVDKDFLRVKILEATGDWRFHQPSGSLVKLDETFYSSSIGPNGSFAVDLKLEVNPDALPLDAADVNVTLKVLFPRKKVPMVFSVMIPVNSGVAAEGNSSSSVIWFMVFLILIFLVAAVSYVYGEGVAQSFHFPRLPSSHRSSIELQRT